MSYRFVDKVKRELTSLGVIYEVVSESELREKRLKRFNVLLLLALSCYMPSVAKRMMAESKEDIKLRGILFAERKWKRFIEGSISGRGRVRSEVVS